MLLSIAGINAIKKHEGLRLKAYRDPVGVWTIGYGNTYYENGQKVKQGDTITQVRADELFINILNQFAGNVRELVKSNINQHQLDALTSFAYNVGIGNLAKSTLLKKVNANPQDPTIRNEFMKWNKAGGSIWAGLTTRRKAEADWYFTPMGATAASQKKNLSPGGKTILAVACAVALAYLIYRT